MTASEIAKILGRKVKTVRQQIYLAGIKPKSKEAIYDDSVLDYLCTIQPQGRPKKIKP